MHRLRAFTRILSICALLLAALPALPLARAEEGDAGPKPRPEAEAGRDLLARLAANDAEGVARYASGTHPDPWMILDWLLSQGEDAAAEAFARVAGAHEATRKMPAYVESHRGTQGQAEARDALARAIVAVEAGRHAEAYPIVEKLDAEEASVLAVQILFARAIGLRGLERPEDALSSLAAGRERAHRIGWLTQESQLLQWMAQTERERGNLMMAVAHAKARVRVEDELGGRPAGLTDALTRLAIILGEASDHEAALAAAARAAEVMRGSKDTVGTARTLVALGTVAADAEDYEAGLRHAREGLELFEAAGDARGTADALITIGVIYRSMADFARARTFLERTVAHADKHGLPFERARAQSCLGGTYAALGELPKGLKALEDALAYDRSARDVRRAATDLNNLAVLYEQMGELERSAELLGKTLKLFEALKDQPRIASVCLNLGALASRVGRYAQAKELLERAAEIRRRSNNPRDMAAALAALGVLAANQSKYTEAVGLYREAVELYGRSLERTRVPITLANLGMALHRMGESDEALRVLEQAAEEAAAVHSPRLQVLVLGTLARVHQEVGHAERAVLIAENALTSMEHMLGGLAEDESVAMRAHHASLFQVGALAALEAKSPTKVLRFLEAGRAGSLLERLGGRDALQQVELPEGLTNEAAAARLAEAHAAKALRRLPTDASLDARREATADLDAATEHVREVVARIQREAKAQAQLVYPKPASLSEIQARLAKDQALVVYGFCEEVALAVVVGRGSVKAVSLGPTAQIRRACEELGEPDSETDADPALARLGAALVEPLGLDASVKLVLVSPAGPLCYVPFGALFEQPVALTPSGTTHAFLEVERRSPGQGVLALGDPAYPDATGGGASIYTRGSGRLTRLPATRAEVTTIGDTVLLGKDASESGFRAGLGSRARWRAVHLACHGRVDHERPALCALALTPGEEDDGFLTVLEIFGMKVAADLAVLSACETGGGQVVNGEGIVGLTRAFMYAGTPRVLCSLWKVDDEATRALMTKFYELWNPKQGTGLPAARALQLAQAHVRSQPRWKHPYFWAAWVLWGLPD